MKKLIKILLLFLITHNCFSQEQTVFNYNYPLQWNYNSFTLVYDHNNYFFSGGIAFSEESCPYWLIGHHITKINNQGVRDTIMLFGKCGQNIYTGYGKSMTKHQNTISVIGGEYTDSLCKIFMLNLNENLDTTSNLYFLNDTTTKRGWSMLRIGLTNSIICGQIDSTYNEVFTPTPNTTFTKSLLLEVNEYGDILWSKSYSFGDISDGCWSAFYRVIPTTDNGYIAIGITHDFGNRKALLVKTDSIGNQQWFRTYGNGSYDNPGFTDIIPTHDSCYIVCGAYTYGETFGGLYPYDGWIIKIDNNGNTLWDRKHRDSIYLGTTSNDYYAQYVALAEKENGDIFSICRTMVDDEGEFAGNKFRIICLDSYGNRKWNKFINEVGGQTGILNPNSLVLTEDGGIAVGGWGEIYFWNEQNQWVSEQRIFLIKTDSLGNDTLISDISPIESKPITEFKLQCYPNPANSEFFIDLPQGINDDVLEIYATNGSLVLQQTVGVFNNRVDLCNVKPGMYLVRVRGVNLYGKIIVN